MIDHIDTRRSEVVNYNHRRQHLGCRFNFAYMSQVLITIVLCTDGGSLLFRAYYIGYAQRVTAGGGFVTGCSTVTGVLFRFKRGYYGIHCAYVEYVYV